MSAYDELRSSGLSDEQILSIGLKAVEKLNVIVEPDSWRAGFRAGWEASGEGFNGEYPDEGVAWEDSAGRQAMFNAEAHMSNG